MPEYIILQCFSCKIFQVHIVKKSSKWKCKLCSARQSVIKIFMKHETAKECRVVVQEMNEKYIRQEELVTMLLSENGCTTLKELQVTEVNADKEFVNLKSNDSRWNKYLAPRNSK
nr:unnamed protein product [Callosobruchus analis]